MNRLQYVDGLVRFALQEDIGSGDVTADLIPASTRFRARIITREFMVLCGVPWVDAVFGQLDPSVVLRWSYKDGDEIEAGEELCCLEGPARPILTGERTALNFLQTLSGTATVVRRYTKILEGTSTQVLDTRKTLPALREAQKYAVSCGGGRNHRIGLYDGILIKENHIAAAGSISAAVATARTLHPSIPVEVEVENLSQLDEAIEARADSVLLDNFSLDGLSAAVQRTAGRLKLEASGGFDLDSLSAAAATGIDYISVGSLTKHVRAIDLSMRFSK